MTIPALYLLALPAFAALFVAVELNSRPLLIAGFVVLCATTVAALVIDHGRAKASERRVT